MNEKNEMVLVLPEETIKTLGIDEDTAFETYFEDGAIKIRVLEEEVIYGGDIPLACEDCANFCWHRCVCTLKK